MDICTPVKAHLLLSVPPLITAIIEKAKFISIVWQIVWVIIYAWILQSLNDSYGPTAAWVFLFLPFFILLAVLIIFIFVFKIFR